MTLGFTFNSQHFLADLMAGDLFTWGIVLAVVFFSGWQAYEKYCTFSSPVELDEE